MIPEEIKRQHILQAISEIDANGVPRNREATGFDLVYEGKFYPPKYVLSLAAKHATGKELPPSEFTGGVPTNSLLSRLGFEIVTRQQQGIREQLERIMEGYVQAANREPFGKSSGIWTAFTDLSTALRGLDRVRSNPKLRVRWSVGQGNWTKVPWLALLDERETNTTQHGVYVVFLFRQDMSGVYLTLAQGVTEPKKKLGAREARDFLHNNAAGVRTLISDVKSHGFVFDDGIQLSADPGLGSDYEDSVIAYKLYERNNVPDDATIEGDLSEILNAYDKYLDDKKKPSRWWIFQSSPKYYDLTGALENLKEIKWLVTAHAQEMALGDIVYLWEAGEGAGLVASGVITSEPAPLQIDDNEQRFVLDRGKFEGSLTRATLRVERILPQRLLRSELLLDDVLKGLSVILQPQSTNFRVTESQASRIEELIAMQLQPQQTQPGLSPLQQLSRIVYMPEAELTKIQRLLKSKRQIIFEGPPGSGKTFVARHFARFMAGVPFDDSPTQQVRIVQFHQSYGYEDFVEGIRPQSNGGTIEYNVVPGIFKRLCSDARADLDRKYVLVIDEINRGNISRIFGELLLLLEYRGLDVELPYQKDGEKFSIPPNLYLIGTMNTTDRSLAQIDYALRRRFFFYRLLAVKDGAAPVLRSWLDSQAEVGAAERDKLLMLFIHLNTRVQKELGEHFQIGHSYFMDPRVGTTEGRSQLWEFAIMPLLEEYFYNRRDRQSLLKEFSLESLEATESKVEAASA
jgi:hypothetical protein